MERDREISQRALISCCGTNVISREDLIFWDAHRIGHPPTLTHGLGSSGELGLSERLDFVFQADRGCADWLSFRRMGLRCEQLSVSREKTQRWVFVSVRAVLCDQHLLSKKNYHS